MKKFQIGTLVVAAVLAIGGGSIFAAEKVAAQRSVTVDGIQIESGDEALLKAVENGEVKVAVEDAEGLENVEMTSAQKSVTVDGIQIESADEELLKAIENGEVKVIME